MRGLALSAALLALLPFAALAGHGDAPPVFTQLLSFATSTPTEAQMLAGAAGTPAIVGGELRIPLAQARLPIVMLVHGETGVGTGVRHWAEILNGIGLGVFVLDSFSGRGIAETSTDPSRLAHAAMLVDAYRALAMLASHPRVDVRRAAILGFSTGGWAALYANVRRFQRLHNPRGLEFAAQLAFYPPCTANVARLKQAGADAALIELAGAPHFFDLPDVPPQVRLPGVRRGSCLTEERAEGVVNRATDRPPTRAECWQPGATMGHDARAYEAAMRRVKETLVATLGGG